MKNFFAMMAFLFSSLSNANLKSEESKDVWLNVDIEVVRILDVVKSIDYQVLAEDQEVALVKLNSDNVGVVSAIVHQQLKKCGGFFLYENSQEAIENFNNREKMEEIAQKGFFTSFKVNQQDIVFPLMAQLNQVNMLEQVKKMSSFFNRHFKSETGLQSQQWLKGLWDSYAAGRNDVKVDFVQHDFLQPSIVMTILGKTKPNEVVIIGGHADSVNGSGLFPASIFKKAPGADDNASGISVLSEVARVILQSGTKFDRTIMVMAYAGEEGGLLGSKAIAKQFKDRGVNVAGVLQLDMVNFKGSVEDIYIISDFTNEDQNTFLGQIIDEYVGVPWGYAKCGYGCSDHASWTKNGYPASFVFESVFKNANKAIHSDKDILEVSSGSVAHAYKFAKLTLAYVVEMAR